MLDAHLAYAWSKLLNHPSYRYSNIDSAYQYILYAQNNFSQLDDKSIEKMGKEGIDAYVLDQQKLSIDKKAFDIAQRENTEESYTSFIVKFPTAAEIREAIRLREETGFKAAVIENKEASFMAFMEKYPDSPYVNDALKKYERLYFVRVAGSGTLSDLINYLKEKPQSDFREEVEQKILNLKLIACTYEDFEELASLLNTKNAIRKLKTYHFHWFRTAFPERHLSINWLNDSLKNVLAISSKQILPITRPQGFNFVDTEGKVLFNKDFPILTESSKCDFSPKDLFLISEGENSYLSAVDGSMLYTDQPESFADIGYGFIKIIKREKAAVFHKSGAQLTEFLFDDVESLNGHFLLISNTGKKGLISLAGDEIIPAEYESISIIGKNIILEKAGKVGVVHLNELKKIAEDKIPNIVMIYEDFEQWPHDRIWVKAGNQEGLIDVNSGFAIKLNEQSLKLAYKGFILSSGEGNYYLNDNVEIILSEFEQVEANETFVMVRTKEGDILTNPLTEEKIEADSVRLWGRYFALIKRNNQFQIVVPDTLFEVSSDFKLRLVKGEDMVEYLEINQKGETKLMDKDGNILIHQKTFSANALGKEYIVIYYKNYNYLYSSKGELLLNEGFSHIAADGDGGVKLVSKGEFGYFHLNDDIYVPARHRNPVRRGINGQVILSGSEGYYISNPFLKIDSEDHFEEIEIWNEDLYLVKKNGLYNFYDLKNGLGEEVKFSNIKAMNIPGFFLIKSPAGNGLLHSKKGVIIPAEFTFINEKNGIFIAERFFSSAEYYIRIYFDQLGNPIWAGGMTPEQYDILYCHE